MDLMVWMGIALSIIEDHHYRQQSVSFSPGDVLVIFSDGITDATNDRDTLFGWENFRQVVLQHRDTSAASLVEMVFRAVDQHAGDTAQFDDLTLVVIRRTE